MELNKTRCKDCGHLNRWYGYKWVDSEQRREHNRRNREECPKCGSTNVENVEDDETMGPYRAMAGLVAAMAQNKAEGRPLTEGLHEGDGDVRAGRAQMDGRRPEDMDPKRKADERAWGAEPASSGRKEKKRMKVYVSGTSKRADLANEVMQRLQDDGHEVTFDWTIDIPNEDSMDTEQLAQRAQTSIEAVRKADVLILLMTKEMRSVGSMVEVGVALGGDKIVLVAELEEGFSHFFSFHPLVWRAHSVAGVMKQLVAIEG